MSADGILSIVVAGFPYNEINPIVDVLAQCAVESGLDCTGTSLNVRDTFGLRTSSYQLRIGARARGVYVPVGEGDVLLGLEAGCAARAAAETMGEEGIAVVSTWDYHPPFQAQYPTAEASIEMIRRLVRTVIAVDGIALGGKAGSTKIADGLVDMAMFGALCGTGRLPFATRQVEAVLAARYRSPDDDARVLAAFRLGLEETASASRAPVGVASA